MRHNPFFLALAALLSIVFAAGPALAVPTVSNSPASATRPGYVTTGTQSFAGNKTFLGTTSITTLLLTTGTFSGTTTFNKTPQQGVAELLTTWKVNNGVNGTDDGDSVGKLEVLNSTTADDVFVPQLAGTSASTHLALRLTGNATTDSGTNPVIYMDGRIGASTLVTTRPLWGLYNHTTQVLAGLPLNSGANLVLSWGTQSGAAPNVSALGAAGRSVGTRLVTYSQINSVQVDNAIGSNGANIQWYSVAGTSTSHYHDFYAGQTPVFRIRGDGLLNTTGAQIHKTRVATTTPITAAVTDHNIVVNLASAGAWTLNLPAVSGNAGLEYYIFEGKGDGAANNGTIDASGSETINGATTYVISANFGSVKLTCDGTQWLAK